LLKSLHRFISDLFGSGLTSRQFGRLLSCLIAALVLAVLVTSALSPHTSAQGNDAREAALNKKADKILQGLRSAVDEDRRAAEKGKLRAETSAVHRLSRLARVRNQSDNNLRVSVAVILTDDSEAELKTAGFQVQARTGDIATLDVNVDQLPELASLTSVRKIFASVLRHPLNDRARQSAGLEDTAGQRAVPQTGRGVVVGIIDTGIDFRHADFTVPGSGGRQTRIKAMLDMTEYGTQSPDPGWNYTLPGKSAVVGHLYSEADINAALQNAKPADQNADLIKQRDKAGHGTHVAGTAAGNGLASPTTGTYAGMAPEADLIIVKASRQNDGEDDFDTTDIINGLEFIKQKAAELGEPFVINVSIGGQIGPHDGTTPDERAIDSLVNSGTGRAVCVAAGNEGGSSTHARGTVPAGGSQTLEYNVNGAAQIIDLYQNKADRFNVTVTSPDGVVLGPLSYNANGFSVQGGQAANQYLQMYNANDDKGDGDAANDQPDVVVLFKPGAPDGQWKVTLTDADSNANQSYDAWTEGDGVYFSTFVDNDSHLVSSPGTARGAITVGAFVTRSISQAIGAPASFTSPGPTADGRQKPDISAPGYYLYSSRSTDITAANFGTIGTGANAPTDSTHYTGLAGTSMATPVATGAVALFLESNPSLTPQQIKDSIDNAATHDFYTGASDWGSRLGFGKLNIAAAIQLGGRPVYTISGHVNNTLSPVTLTLSGSQSGILGVDASGNYRFRNLVAGGSYTITPSVNSGIYTYTFAPPSYTFSNLSANQTADFTAKQSTVSISGYVRRLNGAGAPGVFVWTYNNRSATTDANGYYVIANLSSGQSYDLFVSNGDYNFEINHQNLGVLTGDAIAADFVGRAVFKISGRVTDEAGNSLSGASLQASGPFEPSATSDVNGNYRLNSILEGSNYSITISLNGYVFSPNGLVINNADATRAVDFIGRRGLTFAIFGTVKDTVGRAVRGVSITLRGGGPTLGSAITDANGVYRFNNIEGGWNYVLSSSEYHIYPGEIVITALSSDAQRDFTVPSPSQIDDARFFVSQHYRDFLNREPDAAGLNFWASPIEGCFANPQCVQERRVNTSAAFFLSIEFQETGYLVERLYKSGYGDATGTSTLGSTHQLAVPVIRSGELLDDSKQIGQGLIVGQTGWQQVLETNKVAFLQAFVQRTRFTTALPLSLTPEQFVNQLFANAGVTPSDSERAAIINEFGGAGTSADSAARARALRRVAENSTLALNEKNRAFVLMQYFGYLRRDPNTAPDSDHTGYDYWLQKLNQFNGNFVNAEMVKAFIDSDEYRHRFGP
jgi:subtilisin family serine protease